MQNIVIKKPLWPVMLDNKHVGNIYMVDHNQKHQFQYFAKGSKVGGEIFPTFDQVVESLKSDQI